MVADFAPIAQRQHGTLLRWRGTEISLFADRHKHKLTFGLVVDTEAYPLPRLSSS